MTTLDDMLEATADLTSHHIEGIAREGNKRFSCPLITQVEDELWQGGTPAEVGAVPSYFKTVVNLYPWETYRWNIEVTTMLTVPLFDSQRHPLDPRQLNMLADFVNASRRRGPVLVHCQAGINRSALVTGLALVRAGREPKEAIDLMRERRSPALLSNWTFEQFLRRQPRGRGITVEYSSP